MEQTIFCKNLAKSEEKTFAEYVSQKMDKFTKLLKKFSEDAQLLKISIQKFEKHNAYEVELCLCLPTRSIVAKEASHQINKAVDLSLDRLVAQLKKHMALLRKERSHRTIRKQEVGKLEFQELLKK